jgi:hypothetical protein
MRGVLLEYGICLPTGNSTVIKALPSLLEDTENGLPMMTRHMLAVLREEYDALAKRIAQRAATGSLVPRQASSGGKERLLGISKRGDSYLRGC